MKNEDMCDYDLALLSRRMNRYVLMLIRSDLNKRNGVYRRFDAGEVKALAAFLEDSSSTARTDVAGSAA